MASGNFLMSTVRGKLGDVVFYRSRGEQRARARIRKIANPNSIKQRVQRAVLANVARLYSMGQVLFDHSWQGEKVGQGSQIGFMRDNLNILRGLVVDELNNVPANGRYRSRVGVPGISVGVPFEGMQISKGTYQQSLFQRIVNENGTTKYRLPQIGEDDTELLIGEYARRYGMVPGDIYTVVGIAVSDALADVVYQVPGARADDGAALVYPSMFYYFQLRVMDDIYGNVTRITNATTLSSMFDVVEANSRGDLAGLALNSELDVSSLDDTTSQGVIGVIRSRMDSDLRSDSYAYFSDNNFGLSPNHIGVAWDKDNALEGADLILEGENF